MSRPGKVRVAVLMGGRSSEHEISVASARSVLAELDPERYEAVTVEIARRRSSPRVENLIVLAPRAVPAA